MTETWKEVPGYPGYEVSDQGRVRSWRRQGPGAKLADAPKLRKLQKDKDGYLKLRLCRDGEIIEHRVHHLVLRAFQPEEPELEHAEHLDGDNQNNRVENLAWATAATNNRRRIQHGTVPRGTRNCNARLTEVEVRKIRELRKEGQSLKQLAHHFGVSVATCSSIALRKTWRHVA